MQDTTDLQMRLYREVTPRGSSAAILELLGMGAPLNEAHPEFGDTVLANACKCDNVAAINVLLAHGADPRGRFSYRSPVDGRIEAHRTALHYVKSADATLALIRGGAIVDAADADGVTPLMCAIAHGRPAVVRLLLETGGSVDDRVLALADSKRQFWQEIASSPALSIQQRDHSRKRLGDFDEIRRLLHVASNASNPPNQAMQRTAPRPDA